MRTAPDLLRSLSVEPSSAYLPTPELEEPTRNLVLMVQPMRVKGVARFFAPIPGTLFAAVASNGLTDVPSTWRASLKTVGRWTLDPLPEPELVPRPLVPPGASSRFVPPHGGFSPISGQTPTHQDLH